VPLIGEKGFIVLALVASLDCRAVVMVQVNV
jgi:hypothetical protein